MSAYAGDFPFGRPPAFTFVREYDKRIGMRTQIKRNRRRILLLLALTMFIILPVFFRPEVTAEAAGPEAEDPETAREQGTSPAGGFSLETASTLPAPRCGIAFLREDSQEPATRADFIAALGALTGISPTGTGADFMDVHEWDDRSAWVSWAVDAAIMYPTGPSSFSPNDALTLEDAALVLDRFTAALDLVLPEGLSDQPKDLEDTSDYARLSVDRLLDAGILKAYSEGKLCPRDFLPQAEAVRILRRLSMVPDFAGREPRVLHKGSALPRLTDLSDLLEWETGRARGIWSVYVRCMETGEEIVVNDRQLCSASLIKLLDAGAYLQAVEDGRLEDTDRNASDLARMISYSSNTGWTRLEESLGDGDQDRGIEAVNTFIAGQGLTRTERRHYYEEDEEYTGYTNYTSARDIGKVLTRIARKTYVSAGASERLYGLMLDQANRSKIPRPLPASAVCANKTGELSDVQNDAAIIRGESCTYILVVMSEENRTQRAGIREIGRISELVYDYLNEE